LIQPRRDGRRRWPAKDEIASTEALELSEDEWPEILCLAMLQLSCVLAPGELPFARDAFGNRFLLDTRETPAAALMLLLDDKERRVPVAESPSQFIDGLHEREAAS
jgi:hypothetical protein